MGFDAIMLTGVPRSGTTLSCHLLNRLPNTVALAEPMNVGKFARLRSRAAILDMIEQFVAEQRATLLSRRVAVSRQVGGGVKDNFFTSERGPDGLRHSQGKPANVSFDKPLNSDFQIVIKHPAAFTALLPELAARFPCYAIIRNPLSLLASWDSVKIPVNDGRAPAAERLASDLKQALKTLKHRYDRQLCLMNWYFEQYRQHLTPECILRYEDIIESGGAVLAAIVPSAGSLHEQLENRNRSDAYDWTGISSIAERLLDSEGAYWDFYSRDEVRGLLK
ncbi:MAG: hypothetical protein ACR2QZ_08500 [Woeseiaceae bacterium]